MIQHRSRSLCSFLLASLAVISCDATDDGEDPAVVAARDVELTVAEELDHLVEAVEALQAAAPEPDDDGWNATDDADAVNRMRHSWHEARVAYERVEGAIAVLFPELDASTDERYDGFIETTADSNLFDGEGVTGVHAIERILWADAHPDEVIAFEMGLSNYVPATFPTDRAQATAFRDELAARLVADVHRMRDELATLTLDPATAYGGVLGSIAEQLEKVELAQTGEQESRYARHTLADMRANLEGGAAIFSAFEPWLRSLDGGDAAADAVLDGMARVDAAYAELSGDALPPVPETWSSAMPTADDLATPYGSLHAKLTAETDLDDPGSLLSAMVAAADLMDLPVTP